MTPATGTPAARQVSSTQALAPLQAGFGERQPAEPVVDVRIDAGVVEHQVGPNLLQQPRQVLGEQGQIGFVLEPGLERQIQIARPLVQREVGPAVHREGEHAVVALEDRGGAVALMDVEVDHQRALDPAVGEQHPGRDRDVVEHAESRALLGEGVVAAARGVAGKAMLEREARRQQRCRRWPRARAARPRP